MKKSKENFWSDVVFIGACTAAGLYCLARVREAVNDAPLPAEKPAVIAAMPRPEVPKKPLEQIVVDEKKSEKIVINEKPGLAIVQPRDSFQFYGDRVLKGGKYRQVDADLYELLMQMADSYQTQFKQPLFVGPMWDDQGHSKNSKHYQGRAVDIDFGANIGTEQYKNDRKKAEFLLRYVQKYAKEHNKEFKVIFNDKDFIREGLCTYFEGHHNHIHVSK